MNPSMIIGGIQSLAGIAQAIAGSAKARRAQRGLENLQTPNAVADPEINNYYQQANANPYSTSLYQQAAQNAGRNLAGGLTLLQGKHSALAGISGLVRNQNDALLRAGVAAEQQQKQMLGQATRMKSMDNQRLWEINKLMPYQKTFSLLGAKASAGNQIANAGWGNIFGGLQTAAMGYGGGGQKATYTPGAGE